MSKFSNIVGFVKNNAKSIGIATASATAFATAAVLTGKALTKVDKVKEEYEEKMKDIESVLENPDIPEETYSQEDAENDTRIIKTQAVVKSVTAFAPVAAVIGASIIGSRILGAPMVFTASMLGGTVGASYLMLRKPEVTKEEKVRTFVGSLVVSATAIIIVPVLNLIRFSAKGEMSNG